MGQARTHGGSQREVKKICARTHVYVPELSVVGASTGGVDKTPSDARNEELVGDLELGYRV
jgi:hypothetical protein